MKEVYIRRDELNEWIAKHFTKDLLSIEDLIGCIEELDYRIDDLKEKLDRYENPEEEWNGREYGE
jgi:tetrahydromethanopterin S-methyltransferase subunit B